MIEIQVNNLVKSFEVGHNVLDGVTFQIDQGERVGLLGKNGAGKTTLFKILTGELDCDEGTVTISPGHRMGLISQIPVYPEGYTVDDVLRSAFGRLHALTAEMEELAGRMAAGETDPAILKRYGSLSERFEVFGGYDTDVAISKGQRPVHFRRYAGPAVRPAFRRRKDPGEPGPPDSGGYGHSAAG